ncbi:hypothetical protein OSTOST_11368, partial [Ostertagia ostertagi]
MGASIVIRQSEDRTALRMYAALRPTKIYPVPRLHDAKRKEVDDIIEPTVPKVPVMVQARRSSGIAKPGRTHRRAYVVISRAMHARGYAVRWGITQ